MGTIVEFRILVLNSLKYSSKAEPPINKSSFIFHILFHLFKFKFTENKTLPFLLHSDNNRRFWLA